MDHVDRTHAFLSASGAHRWLLCTPSAKLESLYPDTTSGAAQEGTLAHELAELKLRNYFYTAEFGKRKLINAINQLKKNPLWNDEMMGYTDEYLDYVKSVAMSFPSAPYVVIEKQVDLSAYIPDGFGTADCILIGNGLVYVIDFKYGKGVPVCAQQNPQMMLYALGTYTTYQMLYKVQEIRMVIVQPRLPDGISEWNCTLDDLLKFGEYVKQQAALAMDGSGEYVPGEKTCRFCRARAQCRARAEENIRLTFAIDKKPPLITKEEVGRYLTQGTDVANWLNDLRDYALAKCLAGETIPGWKAVEGRGSRDWTDREAAFTKLQEAGIAEVVLWERKPLTLPQVEKVVGKKDLTDLVGDLIVKLPGKPALVKESDKREAITNKISATEAFQEELV